MAELFRLEVENQSIVFTENMLGLEQDPTDASRLAALMRAAHSLKGAARMVDLDAAVSVTHELEDVFVAAQNGLLVLRPEHIDLLLHGVDLLHRIAQAPEIKIASEEICARRRGAPVCEGSSRCPSGRGRRTAQGNGGIAADGRDRPCFCGKRLRA